MRVNGIFRVWGLDVRPFDDLMEDAGLALRPGRAPRVLIVDDSHAQRQLLAVYLRRWGYEILEAASAEEALKLCATEPIDIVISDWEMPGMSGIELCRRFRALPRDRYTYFILLTSRAGRSALTAGLEAGADDFAAKPLNAEELRARLRAGVRILSMQADLMHKNRKVRDMLRELRALYDSLDRDLVEAGKLQQLLVRDRQRDYGRARAAMLLRASGRIGGDLIGSFRIDHDRIAVYSIDVSGHGVASAMMAARLSAYLSGPPEQNIAFRRLPDGQTEARAPAALIGLFNQMMLKEVGVEQYFTIAYAEVNLATGMVRLVQAGHPYPLVIRANGKIERIGAGGLPVGLIENARYHDIHLMLEPGDRLFLASDGITECPDLAGQVLGDEGTERLALQFANLPGSAFLDSLTEALTEHAGARGFPDDVSGLILDYSG